MTPVILPLPSELSGLLNFLLLDVALLSYLMHTTSQIAGGSNHAHLTRHKTLTPSVLNAPLIGGGLVMTKGPSRTGALLARTLVFLAIVVANFGLEGRSTVMETRLASVRKPGMPRAVGSERVELFQATETRGRCASSDGKDLVFHSVVDGSCFSDRDEFVFVRTLALEYERVNNTVPGSCARRVKCDVDAVLYQCEDVDFVCPLRERQTCSEESTERDVDFCHSLIYEDDTAFYCDSGSLFPSSVNSSVRCRRLGARREDIKHWVDIALVEKFKGMNAIFAAAYAIEQEVQIELPREQNVTVVTLFWIIPACVALFVSVVVTVWLLILALRNHTQVAHDERALLSLLRKMERALEKVGSHVTVESLISETR